MLVPLVFARQKRQDSPGFFEFGREDFRVVGAIKVPRLGPRILDHLDALDPRHYSPKVMRASSFFRRF